MDFSRVGPRLPIFLAVAICLGGPVFAAAQSAAPQVDTARQQQKENQRGPSDDADRVWLLEKAYWQYVQANDLEKYRTLWHADFLGWPTMSPEPLRKDHITDWITARTSKGESLKAYDLERLTTQITGNLATVTYRVRLTWANQGGADQPSTIRIIHTWVRTPGSEWQIISGMSAPTNAEGH